MADWLPFVLGVAGVAVIVGVFVLLRKGWRVSELSLWPPAIKITPPKTGELLTGADTFLAESESELGAINVKGAADTTNVTARNKSKIGDITIERTRKK